MSSKDQSSKSISQKMCSKKC